MSLLPESQPVARSRARWVVALAAMAVLVVIAVVAVAAFVGLDLLRKPEPVLENSGGQAPVVAPAPTLIRPEMFSPPSEWDDRIG